MKAIVVVIVYNTMPLFVICSFICNSGLADALFSAAISSLKCQPSCNMSLSF